MNEKSLIQKIFNVQKKIGAIKKNAKNPYYNSKYFDINTLLKELKPLFLEEKLVVLQPLVSIIEGKPGLELLIRDTESDEKISQCIALPENPDPQKMGSIITYYRRYALQSFFLLEAEDDDANIAVEKPKKENYSQNVEIVPESDLKPCDKCGGSFVVKEGQYGTFYACEGYPKCKNTIKLKEAMMWMKDPKLPEFD